MLSFFVLIHISSRRHITLRFFTISVVVLAGDENGRIVRVKETPKMLLCTVCQLEMKCTKTNTELKLHADSKHGKQLEECFPGATKIAEELLAAVGKGKDADVGGGGKGSSSGPPKADRKKKDGLDDLLNSGLDAFKKKGKN